MYLTITVSTNIVDGNRRSRLLGPGRHIGPWRAISIGTAQTVEQIRRHSHLNPASEKTVSDLTADELTVYETDR